MIGCHGEAAWQHPLCSIVTRLAPTPSAITPFDFSQPVADGSGPGLSLIPQLAIVLKHCAPARPHEENVALFTHYRDDAADCGRRGAPPRDTDAPKLRSRLPGRSGLS